MCDNEENRLGFVLLLAMFCIWVTRRILWVFMVMTHALSCFMLRRMEFDADRYQTRLAGTATFEQTVSRLLLLNIATQSAHNTAGMSLSRNRTLPDDLSMLIMGIAGSKSHEEFRR